MQIRPRRASKTSDNSHKSPFISDSVPLYYQLQSILSNAIISGVYAVGQRIPAESELARDYGVSRITVRQALRPLEEQGLIVREAGRGTFVSDRQPFVHSLRLEGSMDELISMSLTTSVKVVKVATAEASPETAALLALKPSARVIRCTRIRFHHEEPYCQVVNELPYEIGRRLTSRDWEGSVSRVLEEKLNIPLVEAQQSIRASLADAELASALSTRIGAALLSVDRVVFTKEKKPVDRVHTHYRSDIFCFTVHLSKDHSQSGWTVRKKGPAAVHLIGGTRNEPL